MNKRNERLLPSTEPLHTMKDMVTEAPEGRIKTDFQCSSKIEPPKIWTAPMQYTQGKK